MHNRIIYDYISFSSKIHDPVSVIEMLGLADCNFEHMNGINGYKDRLFFSDISVCYNGREDMGIFVNMSGQGCRAFETYGNGDYDVLFAEIIDNYDPDGNKRQMNLTRLDVAFDDFDGVLDLDIILNETIARHFVMRFNKGSVEFPFGNSEEEDGGITIYYGSKSSDTRIRIYDKKEEQQRDDLDHWVRCELQLRRENALGFITAGGSIGQKYFGVINNYLRFVTPNESDSNKRRWETADFWKKFIQYDDVISVYSKPGVDYDIHKLDNYVYGQCSGAITTLIDIIGVQRFFKKLVESRSGRVDNPKYGLLKKRLSDFSEPYRDDCISKYLVAAYA